MRTYDDGVYRDMTPEEEAAYWDFMEANPVEETPTAEDYEAALARLGVE